ncbi:hypothetical protein MD484_g6379, partial [Candolleomyces efflorescens]
MLSVFARGLKKRMKGKKRAEERAKAKEKEQTREEGMGMVVSPPVSSVGVQGPCLMDEEATRGGVSMVDDNDEQELADNTDELYTYTDPDTQMTTLPLSPMHTQFLSTSHPPLPIPTPSDPFVDEDFEMTPASSPVSISGSMRKAQSRGKAMQVLGYEVHEAFKGALFPSSYVQQV